MAVSQDVSIVLPKLEIEMLQVTLIGDTPLICHNFAEKNRRAMLRTQMQEAEQGREAKSPEDDYAQSLYPIEGGGYGFPSVAFKSAAVEACTSIAGVTKVKARQAFHIVGEQAAVRAAFNGQLMRTDLVRIDGSPPELREDVVRIGQGKADIRYRGQFWPWRVKVTIRFNSRVLSPSQIVNLLNTAGFGVGVGEWRSERDGQYGMFHVATAEELHTLEPPRRKAA